MGNTQRQLETEHKTLIQQIKVAKDEHEIDTIIEVMTRVNRELDRIIFNR